MNDDMQYSQEGLDLTAESEGIRLKAYQDSVGVWTIGVGHTGPDVHPDLEITYERAMELLREDVKEAEAGVKRLVKVKLNQGQYDALVDFCFNLGCGSLARSTLLACLNAGRYEEASKHFDDWVLAGGKRLNGLVIRRDKEEALFNGMEVA